MAALVVMLIASVTPEARAEPGEPDSEGAAADGTPSDGAAADGAPSDGAPSDGAAADGAPSDGAPTTEGTDREESGNGQSEHQGSEDQESSRLGSGRPGSGHRLNSDLDGTYVTVGPVAGALAIENSWNSAVGAELSLVRLREQRLPALLGFSVGAVVFDDRPGLRTWAEIEVGFDQLFGRLLGRPRGRFGVQFGLSGGLAIEFDRVRPPRFGAQGTLWVFAGIVPYVRVGTLEEVGGFFEAGVMIKVPVKIRY